MRLLTGIRLSDLNNLNGIKTLNSIGPHVGFCLYDNGELTSENIKIKLGDVAKLKRPIKLLYSCQSFDVFRENLSWLTESGFSFVFKLVDLGKKGIKRQDHDLETALVKQHYIGIDCDAHTSLETVQKTTSLIPLFRRMVLNHHAAGLFFHLDSNILNPESVLYQLERALRTDFGLSFSPNIILSSNLKEKHLIRRYYRLFQIHFLSDIVLSPDELANAKDWQSGFSRFTSQKTYYPFST